MIIILDLIINSSINNNNTYGSGEYSATPSHCLPAIVSGKPTGYMCMECGNLVKDLDPVFDDVCLVCLKEWIIKMKVSRLIPTAEAIAQKEALEPTVRVVKKKFRRNNGYNKKAFAKII